MKNSSKVLKTLVAGILLISILSLHVFAMSMTLSIEPNAKKVAEGNEVIVKVSGDNIDAGQGISSLDCELSYDEKIFQKTLEPNIEAIGTWKIKYDPNTKKINATNSSFMKDPGPIFQITFKVKTGLKNNAGGSGIQGSPTRQLTANNPLANPNSNNPLANPTGSNTSNPLSNPSGSNPNNPLANPQPSNPMPTPSTPSTSGSSNNKAKIELKGIVASNGLEKHNIAPISTEIEIGGDTVTAQPKPTPTPTPTPTPSNKPKPNEPSTTPHAGLSDAPVMILIALGAVTVISFIGYKRVTDK